MTAFKTITVPASGATVPAELQRIEVQLDIAGKTFTKSLPALPNRVAEFVWDGRDYLGKRVDIGFANVDVKFIYNAVYTVWDK